MPVENFVSYFKTFEKNPGSYFTIINAKLEGNFQNPLKEGKSKR